MTDAAQVRLPAAARETVDAFVAGLVARFESRLIEVRLFGSYARGEAHEDSDVDCLVLLGSVAPADERAAANLAGDLTWQIGGPVISPLVMSTSAFAAWKDRERRTALEIEREGIQLYSGAQRSGQ